VWFVLYLTMIALRERIAFGGDHDGAIRVLRFAVSLVPVWIFWSITPALLVRGGGRGRMYLPLAGLAGVVIDGTSSRSRRGCCSRRCCGAGTRSARSRSDGAADLVRRNWYWMGRDGMCRCGDVGAHRPVQDGHRVTDRRSCELAANASLLADNAGDGTRRGIRSRRADAHPGHAGTSNFCHVLRARRPRCPVKLLPLPQHASGESRCARSTTCHWTKRHGKVWSQGPLWFMSNAQIATMAVGTFSVTGGGNLIWSLLAIIGGVLFGTFFMAFHSAQGPQLGLPQMIQSRPQFGYVGALLVWAFAYLQYAGFNIFNTILGRRRPARDRSWPEPRCGSSLPPSWPRSWRSSATTSSTVWSGG